MLSWCWACCACELVYLSQGRMTNCAGRPSGHAVCTCRRDIKDEDMTRARRLGARWGCCNTSARSPPDSTALQLATDWLHLHAVLGWPQVGGTPRSQVVGTGCLHRLLTAMTSRYLHGCLFPNYKFMLKLYLKTADFIYRPFKHLVYHFSFIMRGKAHTYPTMTRE